MKELLNIDVLKFMSSEHFLQDIIFLGIVLFILLLGYFILSYLNKTIKNRLEKNKALELTVNNVYKIIRFVLGFSFFILFFSILGFGLYKIYQGVDLLKYVKDYLATLPKEFWTGLSVNIGKVIALIIIARILNSLLYKLINTIKQKVMSLSDVKSSEESVNSFFSKLEKLVRYGSIFIIVIIAANLFGVKQTTIDYIEIAFRIFLYISFGLLFVGIITAVVKTLDDLSKNYAEKKGFISYYLGLHHLVPLFRKTVEYIAYVSIATLVMQELSFISWMADYGQGTVKAIGLIFIARVIIELIKLIVDKVYLNEDTDEETLQRNKTVTPIIVSIFSVLIYFITFAFIIRGFGYDPLPLLTGAGILGMVIGMGAKDIIGDVLSGFFIIFDGTIKVGDRISSNNVTGVIETISLRNIRIRDANGSLITIRNGNLNQIINFSDKYINAIVSVAVVPTGDINKIFKVLESIGQQLKEENDNILENLEITGVKELNATQMVIRTSTKVKIGTNFAIESELRKMIYERFHKEKIEFAPIIYDGRERRDSRRT